MVTLRSPGWAPLGRGSTGVEHQWMRGSPLPASIPFSATWGVHGACLLGLMRHLNELTCIKYLNRGQRIQAPRKGQLKLAPSSRDDTYLEKDQIDHKQVTISRRSWHTWPHVGERRDKVLNWIRSRSSRVTSLEGKAQRSPSTTGEGRSCGTPEQELLAGVSLTGREYVSSRQISWAREESWGPL